MAAAPSSGSRKVLLDELVAERAPEIIPPVPPLTIEPVRLDPAPGRGRRRLADVEGAAMHNFRAAEEARRVAEIDRERLVAEASIRVRIEREAAGLRRELERLKENERLRVAQAKYGAERSARNEVRAEVEALEAEQGRKHEEMERLRTALDDDRTLMQELTDRLREEQQNKVKLRAEADKAIEARRQLERSLELATEAGRRRAEDELARLAAAEAAVRDAVAERDRLAAEIHALTSNDGHVKDLTDKITLLEARVNDLRAERGALAQQLDAVVAERDGAVADVARYEHELRRLYDSAQRAAAERDTLRVAYEDAAARHLELERALSDEQRQAREAAEELRRLRAQVSAAERAAPAGRAEAMPHLEPEPDGVETPPAPQEASPDPEKTTVSDASVDRAAVMAELNSIAVTRDGDDLVPRRR
jgi:dTMP kinase